MIRTMCVGMSLALSTSVALASADRPAPPSTLLLPTQTLGALRQYLGSRPYDETAALISSIDACVQAQMQGASRTPSACPEVIAALKSREMPTPDASATDKK